MKREIHYIQSGDRRVRLICLRPRKRKQPLPGILWIHGGGYCRGMAAMVYVSCGRMLAERFGAVVVSPAYTLSGKVHAFDLVQFWTKQAATAHRKLCAAVEEWFT